MQRETNYFTDHNIKEEKTVRVSEHEVLLSFNNDGGAYAFQEWWPTVGFAWYQAWVLENVDSLSEEMG